MFNSNQQVKDTAGNAISPGVYRVTRDGQALLATVFEDAETLELFATFYGIEVPQRVDELSQWCEWERVEGHG